MTLVLHDFFDLDEDGDLLPGYMDQSRAWVRKPSELTGDYVKGALDASIRAGEAAFNHVKEKMGVTADGFIKDCCGGSMVKIVKPDRKLLFLLKGMSAAHGALGGWSIHGFNCPDQSMTAHEAVADAACIILRKAFPGQEIHAHSWID